MKKKMKAALLAIAMTVGFGAGGSLAAASQVSAQDAPRLTMEDARRIALEHVPGGRIESIELDYERGRAIYEVEVRDQQGREHELDIDANDGSVIRTEVDDD